MAPREFFEARRYSAVIVHDDRVTGVEDVVRHWRPSRDRARTESIGEWTVARVTFVSERNYYPASVGAGPVAGGFAHQMYVASRQAPGVLPVVVLAAPYVRLLSESVSQVDARLTDDRPLGFARPEIGKLFGRFSLNPPSLMRASRIEVQMRQSGLDRVALSGQNPLRSDLRQFLDTISRPYSIRVASRFVSDGRATNVNLDRYGNLNWHLSSERAWGNVVPVLDEFVGGGPQPTTADAPFRRMATDEDDE